MKLHIVPAGRGAQWVKLGIQTFFRQPLALSGLFFIFVALVSVLGAIPVLGNVAAFVLMPGLTMGLIAAAREAHNGKFPMPTILVTAFRAGAQPRRDMLVLGALYTGCLVIILCLTPLVDGGEFAKRMLLGQAPAADTPDGTNVQLAMLMASTLNMPLTLLFCHATALALWHGTPPVKSLFFSVAAVAGNFRAFIVYGLVWMAVFSGFVIIMSMLAIAIGGPATVAAMAIPGAVLMASMVFASLYFTFEDSFEFTPGDHT